MVPKSKHVATVKKVSYVRPPSVARRSLLSKLDFGLLYMPMRGHRDQVQLQITEIISFGVGRSWVGCETGLTQLQYDDGRKSSAISCRHRYRLRSHAIILQCLCSALSVGAFDWLLAAEARLPPATLARRKCVFGVDLSKNFWVGGHTHTLRSAQFGMERRANSTCCYFISSRNP